MTLRAVVSYALDATQAEKIKALKSGLLEVVGELIVDHGVDPSDVEEWCNAAILVAEDDRALEP
jgi:hypothetical protein